LVEFEPHRVDRVIKVKFPSLKLISFFTLSLFVISLNMSGTAANASGEKSSSNYEVSDECEDDDNYGSRPNKNYESYKSLNSLQSRSIQKSSNSSSEGRSDNEGVDDKGCASKRVPKTIKNLLLASCSADATLTWVAPIARGYLPNDNYQIRYSSDGGITWIIYGTQTSATSITLTGLTSGLTYIFQVQAHNANGWSKWSKATAGCLVTGTAQSYHYTLSGLDVLIPVTDPVTICTPMWSHYMGVSPLLETDQYICSPQADSGDFIKGRYTDDIYFSLPAKTGGYTFTVGAGTTYTFKNLGLGSALVNVAGVPNVFTAQPDVFGAFQVYAFTITSGTALNITINP
jgi:hypothetical protein